MRKFRVNSKNNFEIEKRRVGLFLLVVMFLLAGCSKPVPYIDNYPYKPDTPPPAAHEGTFVSSLGTMVFDGDGESIIIDFEKELAEKTGLSEGRQEGTYIFLSGDLPPHASIPVRYDIAHEIRITAGGQSAVINLGLASKDGKSAQTGLNMVTPDRIPMLFSDEGFFTIEFLREDNQ